jgi:hypothetical protein
VELVELDEAIEWLVLVRGITACCLAVLVDGCCDGGRVCCFLVAEAGTTEVVRERWEP